MDKKINKYIRTPLVLSACAIVIIFGLYAYGQSWALTLLLPLVFVFTIRFPAILRSLLSRYVVSSLFIYGLLQIGSTVQFFTLPQSSFITLAAIVLVLSGLLIGLLRSNSVNRYSKSTIISKTDIFALVCAAIFVIPLLLFLGGSNESLAFLGGLQGVDGVNHFIYISGLSVTQHLDYTVGSYYPKGFHIATAFLENGLGIKTASSTWMSNATNYFVQYIVLGGALLYSLYYLFVSLLNAITPRKVSNFIYLGASLAIGMTISLFFLSNFVYNAFLSYFYICMTIVVAILYLTESSSTGVVHKYYLDKQKTLIVFLLLCVGASMSWPLLTPILLLTAFTYFIYIIKAVRYKIFSINNLIIVVLVIANLASLYMQLKYAASGADGVSLTGGLNVFHIAFVLTGIASFLVIVYKTKIREDLKLVLQQVFLPMIAFVVIFALSQYLLLGEVRYYAIKTSFLLEILFTILVVVIIVLAVSAKKSVRWYALFSIPIIGVSVVGGLIAISGNPLQDLRNIARNTTGVALPAHFEEDTRELTHISSSGLVDASNAVTMHVSESGKLFTHMQDYYWSIAMSYDGTTKGLESLHCGDEIYKILFKQDFSVEVQGELITQINTCIEIAKANNKEYYIVTDDVSEVLLKSIFQQKNVVFE